MPVNAESRYGKTRVTVSGEMTIYTAAEQKAKLGEFLTDASELEVSLAEVSEFDSAGVQLVLWLERECGRRNKRVRVVERSAVVDELVALYGLGEEFGIGAGESRRVGS